MVALPVAVAIAMAAAAATSAAGAIVSSRQQAAAAEYNAKVQQQQADQQRAEAAYEEQRQRQEALRLRGTQEAGYAASGVTLEGSPLAALEETAVNSELDALSIRYGGAAKAQRSLAQAKLDRYQAGAARTQGYFEAGSQLLGGAGKAGGQYYDMTKG